MPRSTALRVTVIKDRPNSNEWLRGTAWAEAVFQAMLRSPGSVWKRERPETRQTVFAFERDLGGLSCSLLTLLEASQS